MNDSKRYNTIIYEKFRELSFPDMDATWPEMKAILDKEMPEKKKRRFLFWLQPYNIIVSCLVVVPILCLTVYTYDSYIANKKPGSFVAATHKITKQTADKTHSSVHANSTSVNSTIKKETNHNQKQNSASPELTTVVTIKNSDYSEKAQSTVQSLQKKSFDNKKAGQKDQVAKRSGYIAATKADRYNNLTNKLNNGKQNAIISESRLIVHRISSGKTIDTISRKSAGLLAKKDETRAAASDKDSAVIKAAKPSSKTKGWVAGVSVNYNLPVSNQEMSTVNINGKKNTLIDFLPSVYVQYHFNQKWYLESSLQFSSPQYISSLKLASEKHYPYAGKCEESAIWLNKLYYLNVPASVHFQPLSNLSVGTGIQYSYLRRSIFEDEQATWDKGPNGWTKTSSARTVKVTTGSGKVKSNSSTSTNGNSGNGNGGNGNGGNGNGTGSGGVLPTRIDTVAHSLRSSDWRMLFDVNYRWKRINAGCRFNLGLDNYINTKSGNHLLPVKDRNEALQLYLRYDIFDRRKK